jgi:outer membrane receptor protein involved in Fe transport
VIDRFITYNLNIGYEFDGAQNDLLRDTKVRMSIINLTDKEPPLAADNFGYDPGVSQSLMTGRSWNVEISRKF